MKKELNFVEFSNHAFTFCQMMKQELEQEKKHALNARCKPANWNGISSYLCYALGEKPSPKEIEKIAHKYNF